MGLLGQDDAALLALGELIRGAVGEARRYKSERGLSLKSEMGGWSSLSRVPAPDDGAQPGRVTACTHARRIELIPLQIPRAVTIEITHRGGMRRCFRALYELPGLTAYLTLGRNRTINAENPTARRDGRQPPGPLLRSLKAGDTVTLARWTARA